jgi:hypothetical protein
MLNLYGKFSIVTGITMAALSKYFPENRAPTHLKGIHCGFWALAEVARSESAIITVKFLIIGC